MKRGRPGSPKVRTGTAVGPDYPADLYRNPFAGGEDYETGDDDTKTLYSPSNTPDGVGVPLHKNYDEYWEGK